jgi:DNA-directed RNA polymerase subunit F
MKIEAEQIVPDVEAREILEKRAKKVELKYGQKNALDVLKKFATANVDNIKALMEQLKSIPRLRDKQITAIVNILPEDKDELRVVLHKEYSDFSEDEINKILETVKKTV